jgi:ribokinase
VAEVVVLGDAVLDVRAAPSQPMRPDADVPATIRLGPGGQGANLAVRLARRGVEVRLRCALGADAAGDLLRSAMEREGVTLDVADAPVTGSVVVLVADAGRRTMLSQRLPLLGSSVPASDAAWLVVSGYALLEPNAPELGAQRLPDRRAVIGCALEQAQADGWRAALHELAPSLVVVNADEADVLSGGSTDPAADLADAFDALVAVTTAGGASAALGGVRVSVTHAPVAAIDTTGAGDAFAAALIAELRTATWPPARDKLERALTAANSLAAAVTLVPGAQARVAGER